MSHKPFLHFNSPFLMLLEVKTFEWQLAYASKSTFFLIPIEVQKQGAKKCHVYFEWPFIVISITVNIFVVNLLFVT